MFLRLLKADSKERLLFCPKEISIKFIGRLNRDYLQAKLIRAEDPRGEMLSQ